MVCRGRCCAAVNYQVVCSCVSLKLKKFRFHGVTQISQISSTNYAVDHERSHLYFQIILYFRERNAFIYTIRITLIRDTLPIPV